ncbi:adenylate kinase 9-like [Atheta coriaria]|uniref:adenylate kinase 9-like n=1 Tax=Dalotia coriaria TaxID=877792 RepID=UPI0031F3A8C6
MHIFKMYNEMCCYRNAFYFIYYFVCPVNRFKIFDMPYNFIPEDVDLFSFNCNQHVLIQKEFLKYVRGYNYSAQEKYVPPNQPKQYPFVNSYYEFAEDYDAVNRVPHLLYEQYPRQSDDVPSSSAATETSELSMLPEPPTNETQRTDHFTERKAQLAYLNAKPKCFVILGKPGLGEERLGKLLADYWHCVFINPEALIQEEIRSGSRAGLCIEFNLRCGRSINVDVIIRLLEKRLNSESVKHRGFVLCGFPLIANDLFTDDPASSESAIFNAQEIFEDIIEDVTQSDTVKHVSRTSLNMDVEMEEESVNVEEVNFDVPSKKVIMTSYVSSMIIRDERICYQSKLYDNNVNQMEFVMSLCEQHDYCIIYLKCSNEEVVHICEDNRYDCHTLQETSIQHERSDNAFYSLYNMYQDEEENFVLDEAAKLNQRTIKNIRNYPAHVRVQLEAYLTDTQLVIEKYILLKDPQDIIRLDGRMSPHRLFQVLRMRLKVLPFSPAILPELIVSSTVEIVEPGEFDFRNADNLPSGINEEASERDYLMMRSQKCLGPLYTWKLSDWKYLCPVATKEGDKEVGTAKYAVHFMNSIFFLSNEERCNRFLENPRPYLLTPLPFPICRVFIIGPPRCGKTAIAKCMQHFNGAILIDINMIKAKCSQLKTRLSEDDANKEALEHMKKMRKKTYLKQEAIRMKKVNAFMFCIIERLKELLKYLQDPSENKPQDEKTEKRFSDLRSLFEIESADDCEKYLNDKSLIMKFLPDSMQEPSVFTFDVIGPESRCVMNYARSLILKAERSVLDQTPSEDVAECLNMMLNEYQSMMEQGKISVWIVDGFPASSDILKQIDRDNVADLIYVIGDSTNGVSLQNMSCGTNCIDDSILDELLRDDDDAHLNFNFSSISFRSVSAFDKSGEELRSRIDTYLGKIMPDLLDTLEELLYKYKIIDVGAHRFAELLAELIDDYRFAHNDYARVVTSEEKILEPSYYGEYGDIVSGEFGGEDAEDYSANEKIFRESRRLGNTAYYDPVVFTRHGVLWEGKEEFLVNYCNKMWLFATEGTMSMFLQAPHKYSQHVKPNQKMPPPRICIVGNKSVGKNTQSQLLCKWLGLFYFDFQQELKAIAGEGYVESMVYDDAILKDLILPFWHDPNKKAIGFVMNGFPRRPSDIQFMLDHFVIPDCIVELHMDTYQLNLRLADILLQEWRTQIEIEKAIEQQNHEHELDHWQIMRDIEKQRLLDEKRQEKYIQKYYGEDEALSEAESLLSYKSFQEAQDDKEVEAFLQQHYPPPVLVDTWETEEAATKRLRQAAEDTNKSQLDLQQLQERAQEEKIPWHRVDANMEIIRVYNLIMQSIMPYLFRNDSFLERAYDVTIEMAERLLENGYYFLSRFGKTCPVQMYEKYNPLQMSITKEAQFQLFPMIYSNYIYYIAGSENREKFKKDILKYTQQNYCPLPLVRARVAVIGPPHCGKTTVAERISSEYSLEHITIGKAVRRVLKYMSSSILAQRVRLQLECGEELTDDLTMQCVEAMTFEAKAVALGYVMDGFPNMIDEVKLLAQMNLVPHLILDLSASLEYILHHLDVFETQHKPQYSKKFVKYRYDDWLIDKEIYRQWIDKEYQNLATVSVEPSRWSTWVNAREIILAVLNEIKYYYRNCGKDMALRVANLLVTPYEFLSRQSEFRYYCPLCLYYDNALNCGGRPPDRTGMISYHDKYYWLCSDHIEEFEDNPTAFLGPNVRHTLPCQLPLVVEITEVPENVFLYGYCVACLAQGRPGTTYNMGLPSNAVQYGEQIYLFDNEQCMSDFVRKPEMAKGIRNEIPPNYFPARDIQTLPTLGMLEQYVSTQVIKALIEVEAVRPLIPGLTVGQSALVCLGLVLKVNNPKTSKEHMVLYKEAKKKTMDAQMELKRMVYEAKSMINPYLHYQEPIPPRKEPSPDPSICIRNIVDAPMKPTRTISQLD